MTVAACLLESRLKRMYFQFARLLGDAGGRYFPSRRNLNGVTTCQVHRGEHGAARWLALARTQMGLTLSPMTNRAPSV
jgi:hypothetical protein